jgi:RNA polymerase sigma factor (TIGR02999 family)
MSDVTRLLSQIGEGAPRSAEELLPLVYDELRRLARAKLAREKPGQTLQATALVHEAYLRLVGDGATNEWKGRTHFFGAAAEAMRRILIENARRKRSAKRGGRLARIELDTSVMRKHRRSEQLLTLDAALDRLEIVDPLKAQLVKLRFFAGLTNEEASAQLSISAATGKRYWSYARAWLEREMRHDESASK